MLNSQSAVNNQNIGLMNGAAPEMPQADDLTQLQMSLREYVDLMSKSIYSIQDRAGPVQSNFVPKAVSTFANPSFDNFIQPNN